MTRSVVLTTQLTGGRATRLGRGVRAGYVVALVTACGLAYACVSQTHSADEAEKARAIDEENQAFCSRFGVGPGTARLAECTTALSDVRVRHDQ